MSSVEHKLEYLIYSNSNLSGKAAGELAKLIVEKFEVQRKERDVVNESVVVDVEPWY
jgi:hypothetical protein